MNPKSKYKDFIAEIVNIASDKYMMTSDEFINELNVLLSIMRSIPEIFGDPNDK